MDKKTLTALQGSIEKWRQIEAGTLEDCGIHNCPLCREFFMKSCDGCPIYTETGRRFCRGTPYDAWIEATEFGSVANTPELVALARAEREFLESLLPKGDA